ncbi:MAG: S8 family peptidase [Bryobacterales bacterium]|nr:S8 family peptidase [Bryobacterales bacterium]
METHRHFILDGFTNAEQYRARPGRGSSKEVPVRDRPAHAAHLRSQLSGVHAIAEDALEEAEDPEDGLGLHVEFKSFPDIDFAFESLSRENQGIELRNVRHSNGTTYATVFVPTGKLEHFENLIRAYEDFRQDSLGRPRDNQRLLDAIEAIRAASVRALWTDDLDQFPASDTELFLCEIWLPVGVGSQATIDTFLERATNLEIQVSPGQLQFPERSVLLARMSLSAIKGSITMLNSIAELRRAKETADFFDSLALPEQSEWLNELIDRTTFNGGPNAPYVCLLDTGVNHAHPLVARALNADDLHTVEPRWSTEDDAGHGTQMAGLAIVGNLTDALATGSRIEVGHRLESVKLLQNDGANGTDSRLHGYLTAEAVSRPEIDHPNRRRVFNIAVTAKDNRDRGQPSAWSATLDPLAADSLGQGANPRLIIVSAGNVVDLVDWQNYPHSNDSNGIHDPAQAWNVLTVGAYTTLTQITEPDTDDYEPIARAGGLSPFSTTALVWQRQWPLKPDIVLEGGNAAVDKLSAVAMPSLSLLTTHNEFRNRLFTTTNATSAATALASRMAAQVIAIYPELWPETVRALIVHSAEWTETMEREYLPHNPSKKDRRRLVQRCGYGVPDLGRALWTVANSLTMVVQETLQPFKKEPGKNPVTCDMNLHSLPWPRDSLQSLGETEVDMHITLSYFIEPNPSQRGNSRYRYQSHGLRFDVKRPTETSNAFRARVNFALQRPKSNANTSDPNWLLGPTNRTTGSVHSDIWRGTAADLASRAQVAVFPTKGWWHTRHKLGCANRVARYALTLSIRAPETSVDLLTEVANRIEVAVES